METDRGNSALFFRCNESQLLLSWAKSYRVIQQGDDATRSLLKSFAIDLRVMEMNESEDILKYISNTNIPKVQFKMLELVEVKKYSN